jgi:hypothetical protein
LPKRHDKDVAEAIVDVIPSDHPSDGKLLAMARNYFLKCDKIQSRA